MKRLIRYNPKYQSDNHVFSTCSTEYELLPIIVEDSNGSEKLLEFVLSMGLKPVGKPIDCSKDRYGYGGITITDAIQIGTVELVTGFDRNSKTLPEYIGFVHIPEGALPIRESLKTPVTLEQATEIVNNQEYGVSDCGELQGGGTVLVQEDWNYYHAISIAGYCLESFNEVLGVSEHGFSDDTFRCDECGIYDHADNGYTYNHRIVNDCERLGIDCGCFSEYCESNFDSEYGNDHSKAMELETAEKLETEGKLKHIQRYIGGMTDGRGGYYAGEYTEEGVPETVLEALLESDSSGVYLFTHDESGQFQTYFSVWKVL